ncbi:sugar O-acetyltransferase [Vagococcus intermedius]|uniref:Acetyltransferase n=1 Tax=Vagococcus intermedius TaxID=2991418 RepID=A0AAF0CTQ8_9ENTE|nr:sugar O-acetyltransferase [Vagococcus intermedius]WEG72805.1 sugar O-acetyltransferase [Vagococcus intermedius]WEG74891.1 sugar O-acetyltransferase [Vagococcus intermedius]
MRTEKEKMLTESMYMANDAELRADAAVSRRITRLFNQTTEEQQAYRKELLRELFEKTGDNFYIEPPFRCDYGQHITIGENFYANFDCIMLDVAKIKIGDNVMFGPRVGLFTPGHPIDSQVRSSGIEFAKPITIGNDVWVGAQVTVNPGVTIGDGTIIGSGSVVIKDIPSNVIAAGNPCRVIRSITNEDKSYWETEKQAYWDEMKD